MKTLANRARLALFAVAATLMAAIIPAHAQPQTQPQAEAPAQEATQTAVPAKKMKTLLIINSYHEDELWAGQMAKPVELLMAKIDTIRSEQVYLNNSAVTDMATYESICDNIFNAYADNHPSYVVLVGNFAFTLRDRIVKEWGDIPFLLISRQETYAPLEQYFASPDNNQAGFDFNAQLPLGQLRRQYNFSAIIVPDFYHENINLMLDLIPDMKEFVFISDKAYINKVAAMNLQSIMQEMHPEVKFKWIQASRQNSQEMINTLIYKHPQTGILMSSWVYEIKNTRGINVLTTKDLTFLQGAVNPVFSMRQIYMQMGAVGGAFSNPKYVADEITRMVNAMIKGEDLKQIPFSVPTDPIICVDYPLMQEYDLNIHKLPEGTQILNRPETYFEKYWPYLLAIILTLLLIIFVVMWRNKSQRRQISVLQRHHNFINKMPMPYTKATLWLDNSDNVVNVVYDVKNKAYDDLISNNSMPENPLHLFNNAYLSDIAKQILNTKQPMSVRHHFKRTGLYCYFIFVPLLNEEAPSKKKRKKKAAAVETRQLDIDVFAIDMTKDHQMQQQLKDQAVTIDISMEMAKLVPWQWDVDKDLISFYTYRNYSDSSACKTRDGKSTSTMKFEDFVKLMPEQDAEAMMRIYHKVLRGECMRLDLEYRMFRQDNPDEFDWCENHGVVTDTDSDGRPLRMTGSIQFITDRKKQEEQMSEALTKAKESDMLKSAFLANMSHEIRTPLNAIVGFSNLLTTTDDKAERKEFAEIINRNNELLLSLINDILDLAKIESNTITLTYDLCDIHDLVSSISKTVSIRVPKGVKLNVAHYCDSCVVRADAGHVSQILINLLTNATKFTKRGSITVGYEIFEDEKKLYFYVKDTGIGIKKENLDKVFNRFVKLNNFVQGSGLGLAICRTLVEKMGGEIGVESAGEGRGSMFWFTIPYDPMCLNSEKKAPEQAKVEAKPEEPKLVQNPISQDRIIGEHSDRPAKVEQTSFEFKSPGDISATTMPGLPNGLTVLIAEDNPSNYWLMERLMKGKFKLHHAENGRIAVDRVDELKPDIIIMDINMPELDGYGAVAEMRKRGLTVPIIAVTAYTFASDRVRILNSGFDAFVSKPVSASILYDTITEVWERKQMKNSGAE